MPDLVIDIPGLDVCLGYVVGSLTVDKIVDFAFVKSAVLKLAQEFDDFTPRVTARGTFRTPEIATFFAVILKCVREAKGEGHMLKAWKSLLGHEQAQLTPRWKCSTFRGGEPTKLNCSTCAK
jgi:hypothetical protein